MGDFDRTLGPLLLGVFLNTYIYGGVLLQYFSYQNTRIVDPSYIRYPAFFLLAINTFHCAASIYMTWIYCVENYINPAVLSAGLWLISITPISIAVTGLVAHMFLAHRLYILTRNTIAYGAFAVVSLVVFALALSAGVLGIASDLTLGELILHDDTPAYQGLVKAWLILQTLLEAALAGCVGYSLVNCHPPFMAPSENTPLTRIVRGVVQSGGVVFVFSFAALIGGAAGKTTMVFALFSIPIAPLYSMLIFDTLLSRRVCLGSPDINSMPGNDSTGIWIPTIPKANPGGSVNNQSISLRSIHVKTEVFTDGRKETLPNGRKTLANRSLDLDVESGPIDDEIDRKVPNII
ncbi:hypothetical protein H0H87_001864 [Tephrocybe sp. NHM501043]|nr:hypothetical protein H0H87_001864 [Tephrocybe sp. NHM501043]